MMETGGQVASELVWLASAHRTLAIQDLKSGLFEASSPSALYRGVSRGEDHVALRSLLRILLVEREAGDGE